MPPTKAPAANRIATRPAARTPQRRPATGTAARNVLMGQRGRGFIEFIREIRSELRKVVWPTRQELINLTSVVLAMSAAMAAVLGTIDFGFSQLFRWILQTAGVGGL
jgi:preprotein translocase subunit SecE